jgi:hypothetical protein
MLITLFRTGYLVQYLLFIIIAVALWVPAFMEPVPMPEPQGFTQPLYMLVYGWLSDVPVAVTSVAFVLVLTEAILLNIILVFHDIVARYSMLPAITFIVLISSSPAALTLYPALISILLLIIILYIMYGMYEKEQVLKDTFTLGLLIAITAMFYLPSVVLLFFLFSQLLIFRILRWREWAVPVVAFTLAFIYLFTFYLIFNQLEQAAADYLAFIKNIMRTTITVNIYDIVILGVIALTLLLPAMTRIITTMGTYVIFMRKKLGISIWFVIYGVLMIFISGDMMMNRIVMLPAAVVIAHFFDVSKKSPWNELVFLLITIGIGINNYIS